MEQSVFKSHELYFNKPAADYYVDDKAMTPSDFVKWDIS